MKTKHIIATLLLAGFVIQAYTQFSSAPGMNRHNNLSPSPDSLLKTVLENNKSLRAARQMQQVTVLDARTGNTPSDPRIEFGYLFGNPEDIGNRTDFSVSQQFDFPTSYVIKSRMKQLKTVLLKHFLQ